MIECKFCLSQKAKQYLYAECKHLICLNCAALRAFNTLKCCNTTTQLAVDVKSILNQKKMNILSNLTNEYQHNQQKEKEDNQKQFHDKIETEQDHLYNNNIHKRGDRYQQKQSFNPYNQQLNLHEEFYQNSPIKKISPFLNYLSTSQNLSNSLKIQLNTVLDHKIQEIHEQFAILRNQLKKKEQMVINQANIYFKKYINLLQKEESDKWGQKQNKIQIQGFKDGLNTFIGRWQLGEINKLIKSLGEQDYNFIYMQRNKQNRRQKSANAHQSHRTKNNQSPQNKICSQIESPKTKKFQQLHQSQDRQILSQPCNSNSIFSININNLSSYKTDRQSNCMNTSRNMDKIYKKLQESRSKLQDRISKHNWFMTDKCKQIQRV